MIYKKIINIFIIIIFISTVCAQEAEVESYQFDGGANVDYSDSLSMTKGSDSITLENTGSGEETVKVNGKDVKVYQNDKLTVNKDGTYSIDSKDQGINAEDIGKDIDYSKDGKDISFKNTGADTKIKINGKEFSIKKGDSIKIEAQTSGATKFFTFEYDSKTKTPYEFSVNGQKIETTKQGKMRLGVDVSGKAYSFSTELGRDESIKVNGATISPYVGTTTHKADISIGQDNKINIEPVSGLVLGSQVDLKLANGNKYSINGNKASLNIHDFTRNKISGQIDPKTTISYGEKSLTATKPLSLLISPTYVTSGNSFSGAYDSGSHDIDINNAASNHFTFKDGQTLEVENGKSYWKGWYNTNVASGDGEITVDSKKVAVRKGVTVSSASAKSSYTPPNPIKTVSDALGKLALGGAKKTIDNIVSKNR